MAKQLLSDAFDVLQNRDEHFEKIGQDVYPTSLIRNQLLLIFFFTFFYGAIMGSYNSLLQSVSSGVKLWILMILTLIICFPSFYIVQLILGSKIKIRQLLILILSGFVMTSIIMVAFAPIVLFFQLSGGNYAFLQLLHVGILLFAGFFGMRAVLDALKTTFEHNGVYPKIGLKIFQIWVLIFAFVGMQLSWNLRPFVGSKEMPFELLRSNTQGNFYSTVFGAIGQMFGNTANTTGEQKEQEQNSEAHSTKEPSQADSTTVDSLINQEN